jgi:formylglycine-generating enzyme required for sulfatase activity
MKEIKHIPVKLPNSEIEMLFVEIPACPEGFLMGSRGERATEEPRHRVVISEPFLMGIYPVTQAQFAIFRKEHKNHFEGKPDHPAENMTWHDAVAFCEWLHTDTKLPTEAQWEYGCRAGTETDYWNGDGEAALSEMGWFDEEWDEGSTHPVGLKRVNKFGLYDMHGNVWEWCRDGWDEHAYSKRVDGVTDPFTKPENNEVEDKMARVLRGGSWLISARLCRSAFRLRDGAGSRGRNGGFRVCLFPGSGGQEQLPEAESGVATGGGSDGTERKPQGADAMPEGVNLGIANFPREAGDKKFKE